MKRSASIRWYYAGADGKTEVDANLVTMLSKDEVVRHISQVFCLERLAALDIPMARSLLSALVQVWFLWISCPGL